MENRIIAIKEMLKKEPDDSFLNYAYALELVKQSQIHEAVSVLEKLIQMDKSYLASYYQLGKLYEALASREKAMLIYKSGIEIAKKQKNNKAIGELNEALHLLDVE